MSWVFVLMGASLVTAYGFGGEPGSDRASLPYVGIGVWLLWLFAVVLPATVRTLDAIGPVSSI